MQVPLLSKRLDKNRNLVSFPIEVLDSSEVPFTKRGRHISSGVSFFKSGLCLGKPLVCVVKTSGFSSIIKAMEPVPVDSSKKNPIQKWFSGKKESMTVHKVFSLR